jgi:hypothetical protein
MTLLQRSFGRRSLTLTIDGETLQVVSSTWFSRHKYGVRLADIGLRFDEWRQVAISWYLVGAACFVFLTFHFRDGWYADSFGILVGLIYLSLAVYSTYHGWRKSGNYIVVRIEGERPGAIYVFRQRPSRDVVDRFLADLTAAVQKAKAAAASGGSVSVPAPG